MNPVPNTRDHLALCEFLEELQDALPMDSGFIVSTNRPDMGWLVYHPDGRSVTLLENGTWRWTASRTTPQETNK